MFATITEQDKEIKQLFYQKIREKVEKQRLEMKNQIDEELPSFISWAMKPFADIVFTVEKAKQDRKGGSGEESVSTALWLALPKDYIIINDVVLEPKPDEFIQLDHMVICKKGIFIIETKNWEGAYTGYRDKWKTKKGSGWVECKSPTKQNLRHKILYETWLEDNMDTWKEIKQHIYPLVVIKKAQWLKTDICSMPVFSGGLDAAGYIKSFKEDNLDEDIVMEIVKKICHSKPLNHEEWENMHNKNEIHEEKGNYTLGKTKSGKTFIRIKGAKDDAEKVAEEYKTKGFQVEEVKQDIRDKNTWYFYFSELSSEEPEKQTITYNKLVRDRIPDIIKGQGKECEIRVLDNNEYEFELNKKILEELEEYNKSGEVEELADLVEVVYAIVEQKGISLEKFEEIRQAKRNERGGFKEKLLLVSVTEK